jgi:galactonate dehydratase
MHYNQESDVLEYLVDPSVFAFDDGYVDLPTDPGLGIDPDLDVIEARAGEEDWKPPVWRTDDGTVTEW